MSASVPPGRNMLLAKIHIAKKQLALEEDSYRGLLMRITGKNSAGDCDLAELDAVLTEFRRFGFEAKKTYDGPRSEHRYIRMIYSLWSALKPYVSEHSGQALRAFVKRQTGLEAPEFCGPEDANTVIEGLKAWLERERERGTTRGAKPLPKFRRKPPRGAPPKGPR